ncbi:DNA primase/helicase [Mycobacterium phage Kimona]|uniref:DNA primase/helicase n=1 Tax=Mycobacterium phage Kimona TaxID=2024295 RepID=A0A249XU48_9CAUD|nr:DNA primase/helicase [Mycobacterium phage Kimona]ASZ75515.1 DNA primase/helicase [Mycobacterium phage Kimona]
MRYRRGPKPLVWSSPGGSSGHSRREVSRGMDVRRRQPQVFIRVSAEASVLGSGPVRWLLTLTRSTERSHHGLQPPWPLRPSSVGLALDEPALRRHVQDVRQRDSSRSACVLGRPQPQHHLHPDRVRQGRWPDQAGVEGFAG